MSKPRKILLHIGLPKTGTTSFQLACKRQRQSLMNQGIAIYDSILHIPSSAALEMTLASMRPGLECMASVNPHRIVPEDIFDRVRSKISDLLENPEVEALIVSDENLCFLRSPEELERLRRLFPDDVTFEVFLTLRDARAWGMSYATELRAAPQFYVSDDPISAFHVAEGSWIYDFEEIERVWQQAFGTLHVLNYDRDRAVTNLVEAMGISLPANDLAMRAKVTMFRKRFWARFPLLARLWRRLRRPVG